ncbi:MAG: porin [Pseudomonadota bacterium]
MRNNMKKPRLRILSSTSSIVIGAVLMTMLSSTSAAADQATTKNADADEISVSLSPSPQIKTRDNSYSVRLAGFFQFDHAENSAETASVRDASTIRRGRIGVRGVFAKDWKYDFMVETGRDGAEVFDANIAYTGLKNFAVTVGQFKEPLGLEWSTGCPWWSFMDRALIASLTPNRSIGVAATTGGDKWRIHAGHFPSNTSNAKARPENGVTTGRAYITPVNSKRNVLHLGISGSIRNPDVETRSVRFKGKHETAAPGKPTVDTGPITDIDRTTVMGVEALGIFGPLSIQAEYIDNVVHRENAATLNFTSFYFQTSWFITGEVRSYKLKRGGFARVKPKKGSKIGAIQLAARYDKLDLNDKDVAGGSVDRYTVGLNWHPNTNIRLTANYIRSNTDENAPAANDTRNTAAFRAQYAF